MPWKVICPMDERWRLVHMFHTGKFTVAELALRFGVSRKSVYKWISRFATEGEAGLRERSRAPQHHPNATPDVVVQALLRAKRAHPTWGPAKLFPATRLSADLAGQWPAISTRGSILARHQLTVPRHRRRHTPPWTQPFQACDQPNAVWCADFKGWFRTGDGQRCDPLTITDAYSRFLLACEIVPPDAEHARLVFERVFQEYGVPMALHTDNGAPFASIGAAGLSALSVWWVKLGIRPERSRPGHPEENGRHERMHETLKADTLRPPAETPPAQQRRFVGYREEFNTLRPHQALGQVPPAEVYTPSLRPYSPHPPDPSYAPDTQVRRVRSKGQIKWRGELVYLSEALIGELVGIEEGEHACSVSFGPITLGLLAPGKGGLTRLTRPPHA